MEASKTVSRCTPQTAQATHVFDIIGYSKHRYIGHNKFIRSGIFSVGGHDWSIRFYPDGFSKELQQNDFISIYLELLANNAKVRASCDLRLVDQNTGLSISVHKTELRYFSTADSSRYAPQTSRFKNRSEIEASPYLQGDRLTIECVVTVVKAPQVTETRSFPKIEVPPSDVTEHLSKMLEDKEGFDVTFSVGKESFSAHRFVLAVRSPVFKAELFGSTREATTRQPITIEDMHPDVFRTLLHFIYTDSLPADVDDLDGDDYGAMIRHLLVAADRYAMDRLKLMCQSILCERYVGVETVATTLAFADLHNCGRLKEVCIDFMASSDEMDAVVATPGFASLKKNCPSVLVDVLEKTSRLRKA